MMEDIDEFCETLLLPVTTDCMQQLGSAQFGVGSAQEWKSEPGKIDQLLVDCIEDQDSIMDFLSFEDYSEFESVDLSSSDSQSIQLIPEPFGQASDVLCCSNCSASKSESSDVIPGESSFSTSNNVRGICKQISRVSPRKSSAERCVRPRVAASKDITSFLNNRLFPAGIAGLAARNSAISDIILAIRNGSLPNRIQPLHSAQENQSPSEQENNLKVKSQGNDNNSSQIGLVIADFGCSAFDSASQSSECLPVTCATNTAAIEGNLHGSSAGVTPEMETDPISPCTKAGLASPENLAAAACAEADERRERRRRQNREAQRRRRQRRANPALSAYAAVSLGPAWWYPEQLPAAAAVGPRGIW